MDIIPGKKQVRLPKKNTNRLTLIVVLTVLVFALAAAVYFIKAPGGILAKSDCVTTPCNPDSSWKSYQSTRDGFEIRYPKNFVFSADVSKFSYDSYIPVCDLLAKACMAVPRDVFKGTNFEGAALSVEAIGEIRRESECAYIDVPDKKSLGSKTVGDLTFLTGRKAALAAAGHSSQDRVYRVFHNNVCYQLKARVNKVEIGNPSASQAKEFVAADEEKVWQALDQIVSTFKFDK
ncbi:MAG: hypothetical protein Q8N81_04755 [bacterium]|nr:hypothetical protein [bacterium]